MIERIPALSDEGERRIVVGVDGSNCAFRALDHAAQQAARSGALLHVVCVYHLPVEDAGIIPIGLIEEVAASVVHQALDRVSEIEPSVTAKGELVFGSPGPTLAELSREAVELVVGTKGLGHVVGEFLGSVSEYVVHHAPCTTTVVREECP